MIALRHGAGTGSPAFEVLEASSRFPIPSSSMRAVVGYTAVAACLLGGLTSPHPTHPRFIGADPSGGPGGDW